jgi:hypothetical protein
MTEEQEPRGSHPPSDPPSPSRRTLIRGILMGVAGMTAGGVFAPTARAFTRSGTWTAPSLVPADSTDVNFCTQKVKKIPRSTCTTAPFVDGTLLCIRCSAVGHCCDTSNAGPGGGPYIFQNGTCRFRLVVVNADCNCTANPPFNLPRDLC